MGREIGTYCCVYSAGLPMMDRETVQNMVWGLNPSEGEVLCTVQNGPGAHPASCTLGTGSLTGIVQPVQGTDFPPSSSAEVKERVEL